MVGVGRFELPTSRQSGARIPDAAPNSADGQQVGLDLKNRALAGFEGDPWLIRAREAARFLLQHRDSIIIDDVRAVVGPPPRPNMAGALFLPKCFVFVGFDRSPRPEGHYNLIRRWRLT